MSNFWDKNKDSIKSGLVSAGKYGVKGTKYVAKTGYNAGKSQYNAHKGGKRNDSNQDESLSSDSTPAPQPLSDPKNFMAPPLRPGQKQYAPNGVVVNGEDSIQTNPPQYPSTQNQIHTPISFVDNSTQSIDQVNQRNLPQQQVQQSLYTNTVVANPTQYPPTQNQIQSSINTPISLVDNTTQSINQGNQTNLPHQQVQQSSQANIVNTPNQEIPNSSITTSSLPPNPPLRALPSVPPRDGLDVSASQQYYGSAIAQTATTGNSQPMISTTVNHKVNERSERVLAKSTTPIVEVKPFDKERWEEEKKAKHISPNAVDVKSFAPPPAHKDRDSSASRSASPSYSNTAVSEQPVAHKADLTDPRKVAKINSSSDSNHVAPNIIHNEKEKSPIVGDYHEPVISYAPPPRAFDPNRSEPIFPNNSAKNLTNVAPMPILPSRSSINQGTLGSTSSNSDVPGTSQPERVNRDVNGSVNGVKVGERLQNGKGGEPPRGAIVGRYQEPTTSFAPPPRPHGNSDNKPLSNRTVDKPMERRQVPDFSRRSTNEVYSSNGRSHNGGNMEAVPALPRRVTNSSVEQSTGAAIAGSYQEPSSNFAPPPPPFGSKVSSTVQHHGDSVNSAFPGSTISQSFAASHTHDHDKEGNETNHQSGSSIIQEGKEPVRTFHSPPPPFRDAEYNSKTHKVLSSKSSKPPPVPQKKVNLLNKSLSGKNDSANNFGNDKNNSSKETSFTSEVSTSFEDHTKFDFNNRTTRFDSSPFLQDLQNSISSLHLDANDQESSTNLHKMVLEKGPPPVVKPKPKTLSQLNQVEEKVNISPPVKSKPKDLDERAQNNLHSQQFAKPIAKSFNGEDTKISKDPAVHPAVQKKQPPVPAKKKPQLASASIDSQKTYSRNRMPLPHEMNETTDNNDDKETNPFAIYKKEVVPASKNRINRS